MKMKSELTRSEEIVEGKNWGWLVLFATTTTLVCCALPILLVTVGLGAVSAALFSNLPFLVTLAKFKLWFFTGSGLLLALSGWLLYRPGRACPIDPALAKQCDKAHKWNLRFFWTGVVFWAIGFVAAYLSLPILEWLEG